MIASTFPQSLFAFFQCVGEDIENLEYTPKPEFEGIFEVLNVNNEVPDSLVKH